MIMMMAHHVIFFFSFLVMPWGRLLCRTTQTIHLGDRRPDRPFREKSTLENFFGCTLTKLSPYDIFSPYGENCHLEENFA